MTSPEPDGSDPGSPTSPVDAAAEATPSPSPTPSPELERRAFVRRMTNDTVGLAGRLFGASRMLTRASVAAGQAVRDNIEAMAIEAEPVAIAVEPAAAPGPMPTVDVPPQPAPIPVVAPTPAPGVRPAMVSPAPVAAPPPPAVSLTPRQRELLAGAASATIAVNGENGAPLLGIVPVHWDGETVRFASLGWSRRAAAIRVDPRVSVLVDEPASGEALWLEGVATFVQGDALREAMEPFLPSDVDADGRDAAWAALLAADHDRVVISVRPTKALPGRARR
jgi:hypothetical protein